MKKIIIDKQETLPTVGNNIFTLKLKKPIKKQKTIDVREIGMQLSILNPFKIRCYPLCFNFVPNPPQQNYDSGREQTFFLQLGLFIG